MEADPRSEEVMSRGLLASHRARLWGMVAVVVSTCALLVAALGGAATASAAPAADCQPFVEPCLLPFPNDLFTKPDSTSPTRQRLDLPQAAMPTNTNGVQIGVA